MSTVTSLLWQALASKKRVERIPCSLQLRHRCCQPCQHQGRWRTFCRVLKVALERDCGDLNFANSVRDTRNRCGLFIPSFDWFHVFCLQFRLETPSDASRILLGWSS